MNSAHLKLSEFTRIIENVFQERFGNQDYWVIAEISNLNHYAAKHTFYFHLVEKDEVSGKVSAEISAVAFGNASYEVEVFEQQTGQRFQNGIQILANIRLNYHPVHGLKINLIRLDPSFTLGKIQQQREATLQRLLLENPDAITFAQNRYWTRNQLLKLPQVIQRIAIIASENSAGLQDFRHSLEQNSFGYRFTTQLFHTQVQGEDNVKPIVERFKEIFHSKENFDAVVLVRGGGAQTDFLLFDSFLLARAIARFPIPVITGLGHQKDVSVSDMMAHTALKTPTQVAEFFISHNRVFEELLIKLQHQLVIRIQQTINNQREEIHALRNSISQQGREFLGNNRAFLQQLRQLLIVGSQEILKDRSTSLQEITHQIATKPSIQVANQKHELKTLSQMLKINSLRSVQSQRQYVNHYRSVFQLLDPQNTLRRGFAIVKQKGKIITDPNLISVGSSIEVYLGESEIESLVTAKQSHGKKTDV